MTITKIETIRPFAQLRDAAADAGGRASPANRALAGTPDRVGMDRDGIRPASVVPASAAPSAAAVAGRVSTDADGDPPRNPCGGRPIGDSLSMEMLAPALSAVALSIPQVSPLMLVRPAAALAAPRWANY